MESLPIAEYLKKIDQAQAMLDEVREGLLSFQQEIDDSIATEDEFYPTTSDAMSEEVQLMEPNDPAYSIRLERLRNAVRLGDEQAARGEYSQRTIDDIIADHEQSESKVHE